MGMSLGTRVSNILMYIHNISCLCVDGVYWYECTLLKLIHSFPESDGMNGTFNYKHFIVDLEIFV